MKKLKIEYLDKETGNKKTENIYLTDNEYLLIKNNNDKKNKLEKFKGKGKFYKYDDIISYIEIIRRYEQDKKKMKHSLKKAKDFVQSFNNETGKNIKVRTFNSFLDKIDKDYSEISNSFFNDKTNDEILSILKEKLHFNVKV